MSITFFTPEQEALIPEYQEKWQKIALSTARIDRDSANKAVVEAYEVIGEKAPQIVFCASPFEALERLKTYIEQVEIPQYNNIKSEEGVPPLILLQQIWEGLKINSKAKQTTKTPIYEIYNQLYQKAVKYFNQQVESSIPKNITIEEIVEESFFSSFPLVEALQGKKPPQANPEIASSIKQFAESKEEQEESFRRTVDGIEESFGWLPFKNQLFQLWFKQVFKASINNIISGIQGAKYLNFRQIFYQNISPQQQKFLRENPPLITPELAINCIWLDFTFSVLNYPHDRNKWQAFQQLVQQCGSIFIMGNTCLICDRPTKILLNENNQFHGDGEPALEFAEGKVIWIYEGMPLDEKYSQVNPSQWQSQWVLDESNKQVQSMLMQAIGAIRISEELPFEVKSTMGEYTFLSLEGVGSIRTNILQRFNSETGEIKAEFISGNNHSVQEAVKYAHEYISAEDFPLIDEEKRE